MGRVVSYNDGVQRCTFCGKSEHEVHRLVAGAGVAICDECIGLCVQILSEENAKDSRLEVLKLPKPSQIRDVLDQYVIGQNDAKRTLSVAVYNHFKRAQIERHDANAHRQFEQSRLADSTRSILDPLDEVSVAKSNILLLGLTGVGKTYLAQTLAKAMQVPFIIVDATSITEAGYVGDDVEMVLSRLLQAADGDVDRARHGIVYIDEVDKIARKSGDNTSMTRDVSGEGVQQALLKILEGTLVHVPVDGAHRHKDGETVELDTSDILFICGGAFVGLDEIVSRRLGRHESGFGASWRVNPIDEHEIYRQVNADDLAEFGLLPEFIGRLPVVCTLGELTVDDLKDVLTKPTNALLKQYQKLFSVDGVTLTFTDAAVEAIASTALERGVGARGLRSIIESILEETMFELPNMDDVTEVVVNADCVTEGVPPQMVRPERRRVIHAL
ncbi:ATP-dependent Clp protease ATP-binding subunit ClpX [Bifidobacterium animalis]|uniref:ATP-dependent Clp protease ATP-binding subunit ClpX n=1 Tax=Bifidobacterium animalis TaxID=28025 RepID=UPI0035303052